MAVSTAERGKGAAETAPTAKKAGKRTAAMWSLSRKEQGQWMRCAYHRDGQKQEAWALPVPSAEGIAKLWGSGEYRLTLLTAKGQLCGSQKLPTIDDPRYPTKPTYPNPPGRNGDGKKEAAPVDPIAAMLQGAAGTQVQAMMQGIQLYQQLDFNNRRFADAEADRRIQRYQAEQELAMRRERQWFETQQKQTEKFYERLTSASHDPVNEELEEEIEELRAAQRESEDDGDVKTALVRLVKDKVSEIPAETIGELLKSLGDSLKKK